MRPIKFRAWGYNGEEGPKMWGPEHVVQYFDLWVADTSATIMQFTGQLDINGTEIYEGDLVKKEDYEDQYTFVVKFGKHRINCCGCCYSDHETVGFYLREVLESDEMLVHADENAWDGIRVIGNIHQGEGVEE